MVMYAQVISLSGFEDTQYQHSHLNTTHRHGKRIKISYLYRKEEERCFLTVSQHNNQSVVRCMSRHHHGHLECLEATLKVHNGTCAWQNCLRIIHHSLWHRCNSSTITMTCLSTQSHSKEPDLQFEWLTHDAFLWYFHPPTAYADQHNVERAVIDTESCRSSPVEHTWKVIQEIDNIRPAHLYQSFHTRYGIVDVFMFMCLLY